MDQDFSGPSSYYGAAILLWAENEFFLERDVREWREDEQTQPYLSDEGLLYDALNELEELELIRIVPDRYGPKVFEFTFVTDIDEVSQGHPGSAYDKANRYGLEWVLEAIRQINSGDDVQKNAGSSANRDLDGWEPLNVEFESPIVSEAITASEMALEVIEGNNGYAQSEPEERNSIVSAIKGTLEAVKAGRPGKKLIIEGILAPLKYIAKKFTDAAMGKAAQAAVLALAKWLLG